MRALLIAGLWLAVLLGSPARAEVDIADLTSPEGQRFWLVQEMSIPIVSIELRFPAGSWTDPEDQTGVARFAMAMMDEGAGDLDTTAFAERRYDLAARFSFSAGSDGTRVSARFLAETLEDSAELLALAMTAPRFDADPVERVRRQFLSRIAQAETSPGAIAGQAWYARAFPDHPYGRRAGGTAESIAAITVDDLRAAHGRLLTWGGVHVAVVGAISPEAAGALVDRLLSGLPKAEPGTVPVATTVPPPGVHVIAEDVPQSIALFGHLGIARDDPDFMAAFVMNHILGGGGFSSRLTEEVREARGLAYSVSSGIAPLEGAAVYTGSVQSANDRIAEALEVIRAEWARMAAGEVTAEELDDAKTYLTGSFPLRFDSNRKIARYLAGLMEEGFGPDYINRRNALIEAVTLDDVKRVAARLLAPADLSIVVVGQPEGL